MRKWIGFLLSLAVLFTVQAPAFAADQGTTQQVPQKVSISLDTIETIMKTYNLNLQTIDNNLKTARKNYEMDRDSADVTSKNAYQVALVQYDTQVQQQILNAKQLYIGYCADNDVLSACRADLAQHQKTLAVDQKELSAGYLAQKDFDAYSQETQKSQTTCQAQDNKVTQEKKELITVLNIPVSIPYEILPLSAADDDLAAIPNINFGEDTIKMYQSNSNITAAGIEYENEKRNAVFSTAESIDNARVSLEQAKSSAMTAFQKVYDALMDSYRAYQQEQTKVATDQNDLNVEKQKAALGYSTQQQVDTLNSALMTEQSTLAADRSTLLINYNAYLSLKNGYSAAGTGSSAT